MNSNLLIVDDVVNALKKVLGNMPAPLHAPEFKGNEWSYLKDCLDSTFVSSVGNFVDRFEMELADYTGSKHVVAVVNGTSALHIALLLAGVQVNEEVLVPAITFVATANAVTYCGAIPHFIDSEDVTLGVDVEKLSHYLSAHTYQRGGLCINLKTGRVIRAIVPVHVFGHPADISGLMALANEFNLTLVEDASESLGSFYQGRHTGTFGRIGVLSFNGNKTITTGGGGALLINDPQLACHAKHLTTTAKLPHRWEYIHDQIGFNYRLPNINAALGCAQLESLPDFLIEKRRLFKRYYEVLKSVQGIELLAEPPNCTSSYWLQTLVLDHKYASLRDDLLAATNDAGIMTRPIWRLLHRLKPFTVAPRMDLSTAENLEQRVINLPSSASYGRLS